MSMSREKPGKFNITPQDKDEFYQLFIETPHDTMPNLLFKSWDRVGPVYIDIDLLCKDPFDRNGEVLETITDIVKQEIEIMAPRYELDVSISSRPKPYPKEIKPLKLKGLAFGGHIHFHGNFTTNFCKALYQRLEQNEALRTLIEEDDDILNPLLGTSGVLDKAPITRSNGLCLVNDYNPAKKKYPPHQLIICECERTENVRITFPQMGVLYDWLFEQPGPNDIVHDYVFRPTKKQKVKHGKGERTKHDTPRILAGESTFNLPLFLKLTNSHVPSNAEWKQLCVYFASENLDPEKVGALTNEAWNPENPNETANFMRKVTYFSCTIGSVINYLHLYGPEEWDIEKVFGKNRQRFKYYNEVSQFTLAEGGIWTLGVIHRFFQDVFIWVFGDASFRFIYKEQKICRSYNEEFMQINTCVVTDSPFLGIANLTINCNQSRQSLVKKLQKLKKPKPVELPEASTPRLCKLRAKLEDKINQANDRYKQAQVLLALEEDADLYDIRQCLGDAASPITRNIHDIFMDYHKGRYMRSYHSFTYKPFTGIDRTPPDVYNIFAGFPLEKYRNRNIDIKKTNIYVWLWYAIANQRQWKLDYILNYFAWKLQCPGKKIKKFLLIYGDKCGTGKTTIRYFLQALYSVEAVRFCENTKQYEDRFNSLSLGRMFVIIDDIEKWSKAQVNNLKSKITSDTFEYRKMRMDAVVMPSFEDLICTSNNEDTYIGHNDRRSELIVINPCLKATSPNVPSGFSWNKFYEELEDVHVMGAWFEYLATRDISQVTFNEGYRFSEEALFTQKLKSLHTSQQFLVEYFEKSQFWLTRETSPLELSHLMRCKSINGVKTMWIDTKVLYSWYQTWVLQSGRKVKCHSRHFQNQLADIGILAKRISWKGGRCTAYKIDSVGVIQGISRRYEIPPTMIDLKWSHLTMLEENWALLESGNFGSLNFEDNQLPGDVMVID